MIPHPPGASQTLSSLQIESICYAWQRFEGPRLPPLPKKAPEAGEDPSPHPPPSKWARHGFFLGDGAGVGKGRQIAGCIHEHFKCGGKRVLWVMSPQTQLPLPVTRES